MMGNKDLIKDDRSRGRCVVHLNSGNPQNTHKNASRTPTNAKWSTCCPLSLQHVLPPVTTPVTARALCFPVSFGAL